MNKKPLIGIILALLVALGYYGYTVIRNGISLNYTFSPGPIGFSFTNLRFSSGLVFIIVVIIFVIWTYKRIAKVFETYKNGIKVETKYIKLEKVQGSTNMFKIITEGQDPRTGKTRKFESMDLPMTDEEINRIPQTIFVYLNQQDEKYYYMDTDFLRN